MGERGLILPLALDEHIAQETCRFATSNGDQVSLLSHHKPSRTKSRSSGLGVAWRWRGHAEQFCGRERPRVRREARQMRLLSADAARVQRRARCTGAPCEAEEGAVHRQGIHLAHRGHHRAVATFDEHRRQEQPSAGRHRRVSPNELQPWAPRWRRRAGRSSSRRRWTRPGGSPTHAGGDGGMRPPPKDDADPVKLELEHMGGPRRAAGGQPAQNSVDLRAAGRLRLGTKEIATERQTCRGGI